MFDIFTREFHEYDTAIPSTGLCCEGIGTDLGCCGIGDAIPGVAEFVFSVFVDFLAALGVFVVKDFFGAKAFVEGEVFRGCRAYDFVS
jgi:hypothetical protein